MTPQSTGLKVFSGSSHPGLAQEICDQIGIPLGRATTKRFSNENLKIRIEENVREQDVFLAIGPAVDFLFTSLLASTGSASIYQSSRGPTPARGGETRSARSPQPQALPISPLAINDRQPGPTSSLYAITVAAAGVLSFAIGLLPQLLAYKALNGHFGPSRLVTRKMNWQAPHAFEVLVSPEHGLFIWTPLAAFALLGLLLLALRGESTVRRFAWCALLMVAIQIYVSGSVESWTVAGAFGQRRFVALTILLIIGLAGLLVTTARTAWKPAVTVILALGVWWNLALIVEFGTGMMNRQRLEPARNAYDAFVTIPQRAPMLAYRYFFDRASFYQKKE